jgi:hypothetical protein
MFSPESKCNDEVDASLVEKTELQDFKIPDDPGDFIQLAFIKYMLHSECQAFKPWVVSFDKPNHEIFELAEFSNDLVQIKITDEYVWIILYEEVNTNDPEELDKYKVGELKWGFDKDGYIYNTQYSKDTQIETIDDIDIKAFRFIKRYDPLYRIFKYLYKLNSMAIDY